MALIKCKECGKQISDTANVCMGCGAPVGGGGSVGNVAFENRIEQYKKAGYIMVKREGNTIKMRKPPKNVHILITIFICIVMGVFLTLITPLGSIIATLMTVCCLCIIIFSSGGVAISLTTTKNIEEVGNVLKNK